MAFERVFSATIEQNEYIRATIAFTDEDYVRYKVSTRSNEALAEWKFDVKAKTMQFGIISHSGRQAICIATCLGKEIGKPLLECLLDSRNLVDIGNCLNGKMIGAFSGSVVCIGLCLGLV